MYIDFPIKKPSKRKNEFNLNLRTSSSCWYPYLSNLSRYQQTNVSSRFFRDLQQSVIEVSISVEN